MTIVVNPHSKEEELALLSFLDKMQYDYLKEDEEALLSDLQKKEILDRDSEFENGEAETFSLQEIAAHFNIKE